MSQAVHMTTSMSPLIYANRDYLRRILKVKEFHEGKTYTHFLKTYAQKLLPLEVTLEDKLKALAFYILNDHQLMEKIKNVMKVKN